MLMYTTATAGQLPERLDLHAQPLPDGRLAHQVPAQELFRELKLLNVPNITPQTGLHDLLISYARYRNGPPARPSTWDQ
jgi:hypothetical protein